MSGNGLKAGLKCLMVTSLLMLTGCGKNIVGPIAPTLPAAGLSAADFSLPPDLNNTLDAACQKDPRNLNAKNIIKQFLKRINPEWLEKTVADSMPGTFTDPQFRATVMGIVKSPVFRLIVFEFGAGPVIVHTCLRILLQTWLPGIGTVPNGFDHPAEVTLMPFDWSPAKGFFGGQRPGWGNTTTYHFNATDRVDENGNPVGDLASIRTGVPLIYHNNLDQNNFYWNYAYAPQTIEPKHNQVAKYIYFTLKYLYQSQGPSKITFPSTYLQIDQGDNVTCDRVEASVVDKSARCLISGNGLLTMDLTFDATGAGGGTVSIRTWWGKINTYEIEVNAHNHGWYRENGGRKHSF